MRKTWRLGIAGALLAGGLVLALPRAVHAEGDGVDISTAFPDDNFRKYVEENIDTDGNNILSDEEIAAVTDLDVSGLEIQSLKGVELFSLGELNCSNNLLTELVFDKVNWFGLDCSNNQLTKLDFGDGIPDVGERDSIDCSGNQLKRLSLLPTSESEGGYGAYRLNVGDNPLEELELGISVVDLQIYNTNLTELEVGAMSFSSIYNNKKLKKINSLQGGLECYNNPVLEIVDCDGCMSMAQWLSLHVGNCSSLKKISMSARGLASEWFTKELVGRLKDGDYEKVSSDIGEVIRIESMEGLAVELPENVLISINNEVGVFDFCFKNGVSKTEWHQVGKKWYYINADQKLSTGWQQISKKWYYFDADGVMQTGWQQISKKWYYFAAGGAMQTGWQQISKKWYFFDASGRMQTGWKTISGKTYYFKSSGEMAANEWCSGYWLNKDGTWTYKYKASWKKNAKGWWYGDTSGWYAKNGTLTIDGKKYTFDAKGYMK